MTSLPRRIARTAPPPSAAPGFIGPGHLAVEVLDPQALEASDPFDLRRDLPCNGDHV